jgi:uncharacterized membrane protein YgdD (TMEM256/DUF423 family)
MGALGAHWFGERAIELYPSASRSRSETEKTNEPVPPLRTRRIDNWHDASSYQLTHGLAIIAAALARLHAPRRGWSITAGLFLVGVLLFSGSLYLIALSGVESLKTLSYGVPLIIATPLGGSCLIAGWIAFLISAIAMKSKPDA